MIKGTYIFYQDGKEIYRASNIITKFGRRFLTNFLAGNINSNAKDMAFGIDSTAVDANGNDTRLGFEFYRLPVKFGTTDIQTTNGDTTYSIVYKTTLPQDVAAQINEIGIYPSNRTSQNDYDSKMVTDFGYFIDWVDSNGYNPSTSTTGTKIGSSSLVMSSSSQAANEYSANVTGLSLAGYSVNDSVRLAYYVNDANLSSIEVKFYSSDTDYYSTIIASPITSGYHISDNILLNDVYSNPTGSPVKSQINKVGIVITPTSGNNTSVNMDGLRINDEDTFDPTFGLISRAVLGSVLSKSAGRSVDIEYRLDLGF
jgi:hypothetical protein